MVLDVFPFVDENQAEIIVMDSVGLLSVLSCDLLNKDDAVILRKIIAQDVDISNATAMKACKYDYEASTSHYSIDTGRTFIRV